MKKSKIRPIIEILSILFLLYTLDNYDGYCYTAKFFHWVGGCRYRIFIGRVGQSEING